MDHERVNCFSTRMSCGVAELSRISDDTMDVLYALGTRLYHPSRGEPFTFFVFSDVADKKTSSDRLATKVSEHNLGYITTSTVCENPKTGNLILVYVWAINHKNFKEFYSNRRVEKLKKVGT